ncbi:Nif11-like leader peptide family natural product precursor [Azospirillum agricola]|uniref:Nif11-like leader peptide family natural product precursor n=1 Tax=Azospirillum agricola TaxID=1720247 RepID=UPI000A0EFDFE|nr:Nif11-like leader peptide family natural product precursor [Azospirillum agricola]MBP2230953.1 hypothetical protein [Azospirillum agricola]SMH28682.1 Nitrogen fixation protein of unknown function [Azospirillum lipoferum]
MSQAEIERFAAAIRETPELAESYGAAADLPELAARLRADGYDVGDDEIAETASRLAEGPDIGRLHEERPDGELSDGELDRVSGGLKQRPTPALLLNMIRF